MVRDRPTRLKLWRLANAYSFDDGGALIDTSGNVFREIEAGRLVPSRRVQSRLEELFGESYAQLMRRASSRGTRIPRLRQAVAS